jgi:ABC-2 type transport system ATP-binding protein
MSDIALQTEDLTKRFGGRAAVNRLTIRVERGDIYGFLGPNGAGKSTTLRMLLGLVRPTSGAIKFPVRASSWEYLRARSRIGAIIETPAFYENFSGRRNLQLLASLSGGVQKKRVDEVLEIVDLRDRAQDPVKVYSLGMRQRLGIAQALLPTPELIILDEPTNGLDPQGIHETRKLIRRLRDEFRLTIMLSSHLLTEIEQVCNRVGIIHEGRLLYEGGPEALVAPTSLYRVRVDNLSAAFDLLTREPGVSVSRNGSSFLRIDADAEHIASVNSLLVGNGIRVYELSPAQESLEEAFLRLTKSVVATKSTKSS